jgi:prepilin peptidase CpaA
LAGAKRELRAGRPLAMRLALLAGFLLAAVFADVTRRRIPNLLVLAGLLAGVLSHVLMHDGKGIGSSSLGAAVGLGVFLPLYLLRAMGAGDVKLMAMVGAFVGLPNVLGATLGTVIVGGIMALAVSVATGAFGQLMRNLRSMGLDVATRLAIGQAPVPGAPARSVGKLPYAIAIAGGTFAHIAWQRYGALG